MTRPLVGLIVPSTNPTIERVLHRAALANRLGVDVAVTRLQVRRIERSPVADGQFAADRRVAAAELLTDVRPDLLVWAGTSAYWLGPAAEDDLLAAMTAATGVPAVSTRHALLAALGPPHRSVGLLTPYRPDVHRAVVATMEADGYPVVAERCLGISDNYSFSQVPAARLAAAADDLRGYGQPVVVLCTNLLAPVGADYVVDSVVATLWDAARRVRGTDAPYRDIHRHVVDTWTTSSNGDPP